MLIFPVPNVVLPGPGGKRGQGASWLSLGLAWFSSDGTRCSCC